MPSQQDTPTRLAGYQGESSILTAALRELGARLQLRGWRTEIQADVTASGELASGLFTSIEAGQRELGYMASGYLAARVPELGVLDLPFSVSDRAVAFDALDGSAGQLLRHAVNRATGYHVLAFWDNGFRHVSNSIRAIRTAADCEGIVIRTLDNDTYRATLAALGFDPVTIDVRDLLAAVQSGQVQAQENPLANFMSFRLWEHHRHVSLTGHLFGVLLLLCPRTWYDGLTDGCRRDVEDAVRISTRLQRELAAAQDGQALAELRELGVSVVDRDALDWPALRSAVRLLSERRRQSLPHDLLQAYLPAGIEV